MANKAVGAVKSFLEKLPLKAPWRVAGPVVSSEWKSADLNVEQYRRTAPGQVNESEPPIIPRTTPDRVYDIKYWPRDNKRDHIQVGGTGKKFQEVAWVDVGLSVKAQQAYLTPPEQSQYRPFKATRKPLLEVTNDGYE
mmetsp:Transcript_9744/g.25013  ORF Transcript_9744/g.25013 Transcript_9744/m.25013 type:complete len:138 (+) Transcript_9744:34-447(+)